MVLAVIWHYWIGVAMLLAGIAVVALTVVGYVYNVLRPKYPPRSSRS